MTGMILHAELALNHLCHPGQGPQVSGKTRRASTLQKDLLQLLLLLRCQPRRTPWMCFGFERFQTPLLKPLFPSRDRRGCCPGQTTHFPNSLPFQEQTASHKTTNFQCFCTTFRSHSVCYYTSRFPPIKTRRSIVPVHDDFDIIG
jgi:hypothetical protein